MCLRFTTNKERLEALNLKFAKGRMWYKIRDVSDKYVADDTPGQPWGQKGCRRKAGGPTYNQQASFVSFLPYSLPACKLPDLTQLLPYSQAQHSVAHLHFTPC